MKKENHLFLSLSLLYILIISLGFLLYPSAIKFYQNGIKKTAFSTLEEVRDTKRNEIEAFYRNLFNKSRELATNPLILDTFKDFYDAYYRISEESLTLIPLEGENKSANDHSSVQKRVREYYANEFIPQLTQKSFSTFSKLAFIPHSPRSFLLQDHYIVQPSMGISLDDSLHEIDAYEEAHKKHHASHKELLREFGFYDLFLIDLKGNIIYNVTKEVDFSTNLIRGPHSFSPLGKLFNKVLQSGGYDKSVNLIDFEDYYPSYGFPSSFISSPIFIEGRRVGFVFVQIPIEKIDAIMTNNQNWKGMGLGKTGEIYLIGEDFLMRNNSRFIFEDAKAFLEPPNWEQGRYSVNYRMKVKQTSILLQTVATPSAINAMEGKTGSMLIKDYRDKEVLSSFSPISIEGLHWCIIAEQDLAEVFEEFPALEKKIVLWFCAAGLIVFALGTTIIVRLNKKVLETNHNEGIGS